MDLQPPALPFCTASAGPPRAACSGLRRACLALLLACAWAGVPAQALQASAAQVKAAYLLKFPGFVEWPPGRPDAPFVIAVLEGEPVAQALQELSRGRRVMGRPVQLLRLGRDDASAAAAAHLVFLGAGAGDAAAVVARVRGALVVSERPDGLAAGAALQFIESGGRIRFEAAPENAVRHGLRLSARLLAVSARVEGGAP